MKTEATIAELASAAGLQTAWTDYRGVQRQPSDEVLRQVLQAMAISCATPAQCTESLMHLRESAQRDDEALLVARVDEPLRCVRAAGQVFRIELENGEGLDGRVGDDGRLPLIKRPGYHRLTLGEAAPRALAITPTRCFELGDLSGPRRLYGLAVQVPSLRRRGDAGLGDLGAVAQLGLAAARHGCDALALSPLHAMFGAVPAQFLPYSPNSRLQLAPLLADPAAVLGASAVQACIDRHGWRAEFDALEALPLIDVERSVALKSRLLRQLHADLGSSGLREAFETWRAAAPARTHDHAAFETLHRHFAQTGAPNRDWPTWPSAFRDPRSAQLATFVRAHQAEYDFALFEQWLAHESLRSTQDQLRAAGMAIGLIGDLATGADGKGSQAWSRQREMLVGLDIGAPPDPMNPRGQNWGLSALSPLAMQQQGYAAFLEMLRAQLSMVGGLRLDHVLGLQRLWLIPSGASAHDGVYVNYPFEALLRLIALESVRHRCLIIGEDLGTVPDGFRERIADNGILGLRVLWFERDGEDFVAPSRWSDRAVATTSTHDLPTVAGWWHGRDLRWQARLGLLPDECRAAVRERRRARRALWRRAAAEGIATAQMPSKTHSDAVCEAAAALVGASPAPLALLPIEDALGLVEQVNIPGTGDEHPNWRRRLPGEAATLLATPQAGRCLGALAARRRSR